MMGWLTGVAAFAALTVAHEYGHYAAQRWAGVPAGRARVSLLTYPPRSEILDVDGSPLPFHGPRFEEVWRSFSITPARSFVTVAAGTLTDLAVAAVAVAVLLPAGHPEAARAIAGADVLLFGWNAVAEAVGVAARRHPVGDLSSLWAMRRPWAAAVIGGGVAARLALLWACVR